VVWLIGIYAIVFGILFIRTPGARHVFIAELTQASAFLQQNLKNEMLP
jgi:hypothetical protein